MPRPFRWHRPDEVRPEEGQVVTVIDSGGYQQDLTYKGGLWWIPGMSMYVYFTPIFWRPSDG